MLAFVKQVFARSFLIIIAVSMASAIAVLLITGDQRTAQRAGPVMAGLLVGWEFWFRGYDDISDDFEAQAPLIIGARFVIVILAAVALITAYQS